ncbi:inorganic diphosphatase [Azospirillum sp. SYSU D00513]|uniref:inorganic diphosphatase n=1 Tax=Azospirillum sp. SYSU D00513 TaxID=2812561 RepID=UPI001A97083E|nr:inorganic diphosphatase [Azospirillum sp. SYSU D00513]
MTLNRISAGRSPPWDLDAIIEIGQGSGPVKYEYDSALDVLRVDRFLPSSICYPGNYGFIPSTCAPDGDPLDVLIVGQPSLIPGVLIRVRPVGALLMTDEKGDDPKIIAVPVSSLSPTYANTWSYQELPAPMIKRICKFFRHYKDSAAPMKWVSETRWLDAQGAAVIIGEAIARAR